MVVTGVAGLALVTGEAVVTGVALVTGGATVLLGGVVVVGGAVVAGGGMRVCGKSPSRLSHTQIAASEKVDPGVGQAQPSFLMPFLVY